MNKTELQARLDSLVEEINFLRALYEAVSTRVHALLVPNALASLSHLRSSGQIFIFFTLCTKKSMLFPFHLLYKPFLKTSWKNPFGHSALPSAWSISAP